MASGCQQQLNMNQTQLSNPENMESSAEMVSTQMNNRSVPNQADQSLDYRRHPIFWLSGASSPSQQEILSHEFNTSYDLEDGVNNMLYTNQPQWNEAYHCQTHQLNSLQYTVDEVLHFQQTSGGTRIYQQSQPLCTSGREDFEQTRLPQLTQGEQSQKTKSRSDKTLSGDKKERTRSAIYSENYRKKQKQKQEEDSNRIGILEKEKEQLLAENRELKFQQIRHQRFSAPAASSPYDHHQHHGTNSGEVDEMVINYEDIMERDSSAAMSERLQQESTSKTQPNGPLSEQYGQSPMEQLHHPKFSAQPTAAAMDYDETEVEALDQFNGSQMSKDVQDPQGRVSSCSRGGVSSTHCTKTKENSEAGTMPMVERSKKINTNDMIDRGDNTKRGPKGGFNIYDWIKPVNTGRSTDGQRQMQCNQGKGAQVSKLKAPIEFVESSPKRCRDIDAGLSATPTTSTEVTVPKFMTLSVDLLETDSAFDSASVAHKISTSLLPPADKERMNVPFSVNARCGTHYAWLTLAHAVKAEENIKQIECERNKYHEMANKAILEANRLQLEVKRLEGELAEAENKKDEAVHAALANIRNTTEFSTAVKQANEVGVRGAFSLCIDEVQHVYPDLNLSMISIDKLKTVIDDSGASEGENTNDAEVILVETEEVNIDHDQLG